MATTAAPISCSRQLAAAQSPAGIMPFPASAGRRSLGASATNQLSRADSELLWHALLSSDSLRWSTPAQLVEYCNSKDDQVRLLATRALLWRRCSCFDRPAWRQACCWPQRVNMSLACAAAGWQGLCTHVFIVKFVPAETLSSLLCHRVESAWCCTPAKGTGKVQDYAAPAHQRRGGSCIPVLQPRGAQLCTTTSHVAAHGGSHQSSTKYVMVLPRQARLCLQSDMPLLPQTGQ